MSNLPSYPVLCLEVNILLKVDVGLRDQQYGVVIAQLYSTFTDRAVTCMYAL